MFNSVGKKSFLTEQTIWSVNVTRWQNAISTPNVSLTLTVNGYEEHNH